MNPDLTAHAARPLSRHHLDRLVGRSLRSILTLIEDATARARIHDLVLNGMRDLPVRRGVSHGDFSVSNIFVRPDSGVALIDWEDARDDGLPILDAVLFLFSRAIAAGEARDLAGAVHRLVANDLSRDEEEFLARQFERCGTPCEARNTIVCLAWVHVVSRLMSFSFLYEAQALRRYVHDVVAVLPPCTVS